MKTTLKTAAALLAALILAVTALTGCSGGSPAATTTARPPTAAQIAAQIGATITSHDTQHEMFTFDQAAATWHGRAVIISTFSNDALRDRWAQAAGQYTTVNQQGHLYTVSDG